MHKLIQFWGIWKLRKKHEHQFPQCLHQAMLIVMHRSSQPAWVPLGPIAKQAPKVGRSLGIGYKICISHRGSPRKGCQVQVVHNLVCSWKSSVDGGFKYLVFSPRDDDPPCLILYWCQLDRLKLQVTKLIRMSSPSLQTKNTRPGFERHGQRGLLRWESARSARGTTTC